jgi:serine/threonine protein phosphatase PrpC
MKGEVLMQTAAVFDGHGTDEAAIFCRNNFIPELKN